MFGHGAPGLQTARVAGCVSRPPQRAGRRRGVLETRSPPPEARHLACVRTDWAILAASSDVRRWPRPEPMRRALGHPGSGRGAALARHFRLHRDLRPLVAGDARRAARPPTPTGLAEAGRPAAAGEPRRRRDDRRALRGSRGREAGRTAARTRGRARSAGHQPDPRHPGARRPEAWATAHCASRPSGTWRPSSPTARTSRNPQSSSPASPAPGGLGHHPADREGIPRHAAVRQGRPAPAATNSGYTRTASSHSPPARPSSSPPVPAGPWSPESTISRRPTDEHDRHLGNADAAGGVRPRSALAVGAAARDRPGELDASKPAGRIRISEQAIDDWLKLTKVEPDVVTAGEPLRLKGSLNLDGPRARSRSEPGCEEIRRECPDRHQQDGSKTYKVRWRRGRRRIELATSSRLEDARTWDAEVRRRRQAGDLALLTSGARRWPSTLRGWWRTTPAAPRASDARGVRVAAGPADHADARRLPTQGDHAGSRPGVSRQAHPGRCRRRHRRQDRHRAAVDLQPRGDRGEGRAQPCRAGAKASPAPQARAGTRDPDDGRADPRGDEAVRRDARLGARLRRTATGIRGHHAHVGTGGQASLPSTLRRPARQRHVRLLAPLARTSRRGGTRSARPPGDSRIPAARRFGLGQRRVEELGQAHLPAGGHAIKLAWAGQPATRSPRKLRLAAHLEGQNVVEVAQQLGHSAESAFGPMQASSRSSASRSGSPRSSSIR